VGWGATEVACGSLSSFVIYHGEVWAWGRNRLGALGIGDQIDRFVPTRVPGTAGTIAVAAGSDHTLALDVEGNVSSWGFNVFGQCALGDGQLRLNPVKNFDTDAKAISCGYDSSFHLNTLGRVFDAGYNGTGELGLGTTTNQLTWQLQGATFVDVVGRSGHTLERTSSGQLFAFGFNTSGQIGDGTTTSRLSAVLVPGLPYCTGIGTGLTIMSTALTTPPVMLSSFKVSPASVTGGSAAVGTLVLTAAAGPGGLTVAISDNSEVVTFPSTVTVPAGSKSATFPIATTAVGFQVKATLFATLVVTKSAPLTVNP
jgi:hypothetical protein